MPNPYKDLFEDDEEDKISSTPKTEFTPIHFENERFPIPTSEALDEIISLRALHPE